jgi:hypothetical protein
MAIRSELALARQSILVAFIVMRKSWLYLNPFTSFEELDWRIHPASLLRSCFSSAAALSTANTPSLDIS